MKWWAELLRVSHPNDRWFSGIPRYSKPLTPSISVRNLFFQISSQPTQFFFLLKSPCLETYPHHSTSIQSHFFDSDRDFGWSSLSIRRQQEIPENPWDFIPKLTAFPLCNACTWVLINVCVFWFGHVWQKKLSKKKVFQCFFEAPTGTVQPYCLHKSTVTQHNYNGSKKCHKSI